MSFDGDLEHLPIVDVIQLLHATGKSGTLTLKSAKGESQLVFLDGFVVSANHVNNSVRIGQIMLDMGLITKENLDLALKEQRSAGSQRKPIIQTLIEGGMVKTSDAYKGLEALIEMTIVEVLTWTKGTFSLDVTKSVVSDDYRYFPEKVKQEIHLNTQNLLMDALRIYDERKRDGTLTPEAMFGTAEPPLAEAPGGPGEISAADLGLEELDELERRIPQHFAPLAQELPDTPANRLKDELSGIPAEEQQQLFHYLEQLASRQDKPGTTGVVFYTADKVLRECVAAVCGASFLCATDEPSQVDAVLDQALSRQRLPLLLVDAGESGEGGEGADFLTLLQQRRGRYPELPIIVLAPPADYALFTRALGAGASAFLPRATRKERAGSFVADTIESCRALSGYLEKRREEPGLALLPRFRSSFLALSEQRDPPEVTFSLLQAACGFFNRGVTLVVVRSELIAERAIGASDTGTVTSVKLRIPTGEPNLYQRALEGEIYYGDADRAVRETMFSVIGSPASSRILLLPVRSFGRVIAVIYADFGSSAGGDPQLQLLEILSLHAGLIIDNVLYRKRCAQK